MVCCPHGTFVSGDREPSARASRPLVHDTPPLVDSPSVRACRGINVFLMSSTSEIPVTVLTGYLGSGKTTLLNRILSTASDLRIAVIENEAGEIGIDQDLVIRSVESLIATNGGCVCCAVRDDLIEALSDVLNAEHPPDRIVIETSGLADPAPIAQTFFDTARFRDRLRLDGIVTLVDAKHSWLHLDESSEACKQIALADRLVINKADLVEAATLDALEQRLERLNSGAVRLRACHAEVPVEDLLEVGGFDRERAFNLATEPDSRFESEALRPMAERRGPLAHAHQDDVSTVSLVEDAALDGDAVAGWLTILLRVQGEDLFRTKGILHVRGMKERFVIQAVHMMLDGGPDRPWAPDEPRKSRLVFIGRNLDRGALLAGLRSCIASPVPS